MTQLRLAVVGAGHLGRIHARLAAAHPQFKLVAVVDPVPAASGAAAAELGVEAHSDLRLLKGRIDAAIVATTTQTHHAIARDLISQGIHVLVEKPLTTNSVDAQDLVDRAARVGVVLQVGHIERFNPALVAASEHLGGARYVEARRYSGYTFRSTDVGVVLDLMIHDLDVAIWLAQSPVVDVSAVGAAVIGPHEDVASARLTFANGCVANLNASRVSFQPCREMQVWQRSGFVAIDFATRGAKIVRPSDAVLNHRIDPGTLTADQKATIRDKFFTDYFPLQTITAPESNALVDEQTDFAQSILLSRAPRVTGEQAVATIAAAERILASLAQYTAAHQSQTEPGKSILPGPHWHLGQPAEGLLRRQAG
ncbi:MAG: Gfo/Idh/MocA family oxidoreductase [Planctomycetia bacterium]|nr:Gfo/Idh/MocA family oxidoreductase [Planctomycetia bacterium]